MMFLKEYLEYLNLALLKLESKNIDTIINLIYQAYEKNKFIFLIGNGGSAATASHFAQDLAKGTCKIVDQDKRIKALSLTDNLSFITALGNDNGFETIFEQQLRSYASEGDLLIAISGSGNSSNIIKATEWANSSGLSTIGITGFDGGKLKMIAQYSIHVALDDMLTTESIHAIIFHYIILKLNEKFHV